MPELAENVIVAGRFQLIKKLGQGGMGSVWLARQTALDTECAIKFIEGDHAHVPEMQARFEREAKAAAALRSPHVVQIIDHAIWEGVPFIAMEVLVGEDLGKRLDRVGRLSPAQTVEVLGQVCRALTKAHQLGIVHRDLKPDNIYLVHDDDREIAKVLDFGIAKSSKGMEAGSNTKTGAMLGTPFYMSPEQAQGTKAVDFRADLWSMAVIAYQCVTGQLPFQSEALGDLLMKIMVSPLPVPSHVALVPPGFDAWFARASSRDPAGRFQSSREFHDSLSVALGVSMGEGSQTYRLDPPQAQRQSGGTLPIGGTPFPTGGQFSTPNPAAPMARTLADTAPKKSNMGIIIGGAAIAVVFLGVGFGAFAFKSKSPTHASTAEPTTRVATTPPTAVVSAINTVAGATTPTASASASASVVPTVTATQPTAPTAPTTGAANTHGNVKPNPSSKPSASATPTTAPSAANRGKADLGF